MTVLQTFTSEIDAKVLEGQLETLGIQVLVEVDNCGGMRPHLDLTTGVKVLVADKDLETAREFVDGQVETSVSDPWNCPGCGEHIEAGFDACWNCGVTRG